MFNQPSYTGKQWVLREACQDKIKQLKLDKPDWPERLIRQIVARDIPLDATLRNTLPDPDTIVDMKRGVERLVQAIVDDEHIMIYSDYDVDGTCSASLLRRYLKDACGKDVDVFTPHRLKEGYGPNLKALEDIAASGVTCLIMVDCGTNAVAAIQPVVDKISIIVVDHHKVEGEQPQVYVLINPHRTDYESPAMTRELCACALVFLLLVGLNRALRNTKKYVDVDLRQYLDVVALATVCDVMPLRGLNRVFVRYGLEVLNRRQHPGLLALCRVVGLSDDLNLTTYHLGYILGPRINAAGRMDHAKPAVTLLSDKDSLEENADELNIWNQKRQALEKNVLDEAFEQVKLPYPIVLVSGDGWHPGLIGIVAGRLKERFFKPACAISWQGNVGKGSGRSMPGFDLGGIIHKAVKAGLLRKGGGHAMAVGFEVAKDQYEAFTTFVMEQAPTMQSVPSITVDDVMSIAGVNPRLLEEWKILEPFGAGNPAPRIVLPNVRLAYAARVGSSHVRMRWVDESGGVLQAICWQVADEPLGQFFLTQHKNRPLCHVLGTAQWSDYNNAMQLQVEDIISLG